MVCPTHEIPDTLKSHATFDSVSSFLCVIPFPLSPPFPFPPSALFPFPPSAPFPFPQSPQLSLSRQFHAEDLPVDVMQLHCQRLRAAVDAAGAEELIRLARRAVRLHARRNPQETHLRTECPIELV